MDKEDAKTTGKQPCCGGDSQETQQDEAEQAALGKFDYKKKPLGKEVTRRKTCC